MMYRCWKVMPTYDLWKSNGAGIVSSNISCKKKAHAVQWEVIPC